jgi:hypothetical protein
MLQVRRNSDFTEESLRAEYGTELREQHLQGDVPLVAEIAGEVNRSHAAMTYLAVYHIATCQRAVQVLDRLSSFRAMHEENSVAAWLQPPAKRRSTERTGERSWSNGSGEVDAAMARFNIGAPA